MSNVVMTNLLRVLALVFIQVLILKDINIGGQSFNYINIIIYPLFLILLPLRTPHAVLVLLGFLIGIFVDAFYDTYGVHASAAVFAGFIRPYILTIFAPKGGYNINYSPTKRRFGLNWFLTYCSTMLFLHLFFYFSVDAFTFYFIDEILLRTISTFIISMLIILIYIFLLDPEE
ncbi:MAG: hypothetical protein ACI8P3_000039 [Saprospiraceae bacterium]|jgi:hypothetical protein